MTFRNKLVFCGEKLYPRPTPKLENPLSAVRYCYIKYIRSHSPHLKDRLFLMIFIVKFC